MRISDWSSEVCSSDLIKSRAKHLFCGVTLSTSYNKYSKDSYHLSYESGLYRQTDLVKIIRDTVIYFALTPQELSEINADSLAKLQNRAWKRISNRPKEKKGDYRSEEHTSELQSLMRISNAVFCLKKKTTHH